MPYRLQRRFFALCVALAPASIVVAALSNPPYYGSGPGVASAIATNATASDFMDQAHLVAQLIAGYLFPLGFLAMAYLANPRAPWLTSIGALVTLIGFLPLPLYVGQDSLFYDIARWGSQPNSILLAEQWNTDGVMSFYGIAFGLGSVLGPTLLGLALWRARVVPSWAAACITLSRLPVLLFAVLPYRLETAVVILGTVLLAIGSLPVALAIARLPQLDVAPGRTRADSSSSATRLS